MPKKKEDSTIKDLMKVIQDTYGEGAIMQLGSAAMKNIDVIPTGSFSLDMALGVGGLPKGRIVEIYGPESSGKTTLALHAIAEAQKLGGKAAFIDAEQAFDPKYAKNIGINTKELLVSQPDSGEEALDILEKIIKSNAISIAVVDSVAALTPKAEIEGDMGARHVGLQARMMSQALRKITALANKNQILVIFINQIRMKIGVMYGSPETTPGGNALKFYASVRLDIRSRAKLTQGDDIIGRRTVVKVIKNKTAPPFKTAEFDIMYGTGISYEGDIVNVALDKGIIEKSGSFYKYNGETIAQGLENTKELMKTETELFEKIKAEVLNVLVKKEDDI